MICQSDFRLVVVRDVLENSKLPHVPTVDKKVELSATCWRSDVVWPHVVAVPKDRDAQIARDDGADYLVGCPEVNRVPGSLQVYFFESPRKVR